MTVRPPRAACGRARWSATAPPGSPAPSHDRAHLSCPVAVRRDVPSRRRASARCEALPPRAPRPCPLAAPRCAILTLHPRITVWHCPWGLPTPGGAMIARRGSRLAPYRRYTRDNRTLCTRPEPHPVARSSITPAHFPRYIACGGSPPRGGLPPPAEALGPKNKKTAR